MSDVISGLMHVSLRVKDYQKALDFYCKGLGFEKMFAYTRKDFQIIYHFSILILTIWLEKY